MTVLSRHPSNPILTPIPTIRWASKKIYNAAVVYEGDEFHMVFRAVGDDWISRLGYARSSDGVQFEVDSEPVLYPQEPYESLGCEDPRVTRLGDKLIMTYTAWDGNAACLAMTESNDWHTWRNRRLLLPDWRHGYWQRLATGPRGWSKAGAVFPDRIDGSYGMLFGDDEIWFARSSDLDKWEANATPVISTREGHFDEGYVEMGPPPLPLNDGWLVFYHGIDRRTDMPGQSRTYRLGAVLLDRHDPWETLWRCDEPLLEPAEAYEAVGYIDVFEGAFSALKKVSIADLTRLHAQGNLPSAVFSCGSTKLGDRIQIYYSGSDTVMCLATGNVDALLQA